MELDLIVSGSELHRRLSLAVLVCHLFTCLLFLTRRATCEIPRLLSKVQTAAQAKWSRRSSELQIMCLTAGWKVPAAPDWAWLPRMHHPNSLQGASSLEMK